MIVNDCSRWHERLWCHTAIFLGRVCDSAKEKSTESWSLLPAIPYVFIVTFGTVFNFITPLKKDFSQTFADKVVRDKVEKYFNNVCWIDKEFPFDRKSLPVTLSQTFRRHCAGKFAGWAFVMLKSDQSLHRQRYLAFTHPNKLRVIKGQNPEHQCHGFFLARTSDIFKGNCNWNHIFQSSAIRPNTQR